LNLTELVSPVLILQEWYLNEFAFSGFSGGIQLLSKTRRHRKQNKKIENGRKDEHQANGG